MSQIALTVYSHYNHALASSKYIYSETDENSVKMARTSKKIVYFVFC